MSAKRNLCVVTQTHQLTTQPLPGSLVKHCSVNLNTSQVYGEQASQGSAAWPIPGVCSVAHSLGLTWPTRQLSAGLL